MSASAAEVGRHVICTDGWRVTMHVELRRGPLQGPDSERQGPTNRMSAAMFSGGPHSTRGTTSGRTRAPLRRQHADGDPPPGGHGAPFAAVTSPLPGLLCLGDVGRADGHGDQLLYDIELMLQQTWRPCRRSRRGCRSTRHDRQATEPPSAAKGVLERWGPPGHTDPAAPTPSGVRQMARLMSITRPPNGARRYASSKGSFAL
jgi:hypothetical protein